MAGSSNQPDQSDTRVLIVGAGLAGTLMACFLARRGHAVTVCEHRPDPRAHGFAGGRSINLALSARGIHALREIGLADEVLADAVAMPGRMMHARSGELTYQAYSSDPAEHISSVSRGGLNVTLLQAAAQHDNMTLFFQHRCVDIDLETPAALFIDEANDREVCLDADLIIGSDGAYSTVRGVLEKSGRFNYEQAYLDHGYKELHIPPGGKFTETMRERRSVDDVAEASAPAPSARFAMEPNALHIWPRGGEMMIALPNRDGSFTCTLFWPYARFDELNEPDKVKRYFQREYPEAIALMPTLLDDYAQNPIGTLVTIRCAPWHHDDRVVLIGDAAHAIVPFYGQGMNAAFEDCVLLDECLAEFPDDRRTAINAFHERRKPDADAIADMALNNFIEMRDKTASRIFLARKKLEHVLHRVLPGVFLPLYNMVSFTTIPYASARARARRQWWIVALAAGVLLALIALGVGALTRL